MGYSPQNLYEETLMLGSLYIGMGTGKTPREIEIRDWGFEI
jgi:hypothetical protein